MSRYVGYFGLFINDGPFLGRLYSRVEFHGSSTKLCFNEAPSTSWSACGSLVEWRHCDAAAAHDGPSCLWRKGNCGGY